MTDSFLPKTHFTEHRKEYTEADVRLIIEAHEAELRRQHEVIQTLAEALSSTTASLVAAHSLLVRGGKKAAPSDKMFSIMLSDYEKSIEEGRIALNKAKEQP